MNNDTRQTWVDYAKAIGIILVVYGHVAPGIYNAALITNEENYLLVQKFIYSFHMPLFFFLSGFFFWSSLTKRGAAGLMGSKIDTIFYAYVLWSLLQGMAEIILSPYTNDVRGTANLKDVLSLLIKPRQQFWYLYALFLIFALNSLIFSFKIKSYIKPVFLGSLLLLLFREKIPAGSFYLTWISEYSPYFVLGILVINYSDLEYLTKPTVIFLTIILCIIAHTINLTSTLTGLYENKILTFFIASTSIASVVIISMKLTNFHSKWLLYIGSASMAIYVMHTFATAGTRIILTKLFNIDDSFIHLSIGTIMGLAAPCLAYFVIQKYKIPFMFSAPISSIFTKK